MLIRTDLVVPSHGYPKEQEDQDKVLKVKDLSSISFVQKNRFNIICSKEQVIIRSKEQNVQTKTWSFSVFLSVTVAMTMEKTRDTEFGDHEEYLDFVWYFI